MKRRSLSETPMVIWFTLDGLGVRIQGVGFRATGLGSMIHGFSISTLKSLSLFENLIER